MRNRTSARRRARLGAGAIVGLALAILSFSSSAFWLRGPGACTYSGDGKAYDCAASGGATGAWVVDPATNVNTGKWGNTAATVGAGDTLYICGSYFLPLTGADARDFLKISGVTFDAANPLVLDLTCPSGVANGPTAADPAQVDLKEDYRLRTWTDRGSNTWSTPNDGASMYAGYVACDDPDTLGVEVDSGNRTGNGVVTPSAYCEYDSRGNSSTTLLVYSVGDPSTYYSKLWASARNFIQITNPIGITIRGGSSVNDDTLQPARGGSLLKNMNYGVYLGTFSSAATYSGTVLISGLNCRAMRTCVEHDGQSGSTYYLRDAVWEDNVCEWMAGNCLWASGKIGSGFSMRYNYSKNSNQSYSAGAFYFAANLDRTTHPAESPISMHHNHVDGVGFGHVWPADGHGIYIEEGTKNVRAYSNFVENLTATNQACFISNSAYSGNSHKASICRNAYTLARASDSATDGDQSTVFENLTAVEISGTAIVVSGQAGDAPIFRNIHASATTANSAGKIITQSATSLLPTFESINVVGFTMNDYYNGSTSAPLSGETKFSPKFVGGAIPSTIAGFMLSGTSLLAGAGTTVADQTDFFGDTFYSAADIGAIRRDQCYRRGASGAKDYARRIQTVQERCRGIPPRYPEGL